MTGKAIKRKLNKALQLIGFDLDSMWKPVLTWIVCGNYWNKTSDSNTLGSFLVQTKTSFGQIEI